MEPTTASVWAASGLHIPHVTPADLENFQKVHFGAREVSTTFSSEDQNVKPTHPASEEEIDEEDALGYYPDGVKRTLTDEQISIFRHSEIYSILRKRQIMRENREVDECPSDLLVAPGSPEKDPDIPREGVIHERVGSQDVHGTINADRLVDNNRGNELPSKRRNQGSGPTPRRRARELDVAFADDGSLDYGEETHINPSKPAQVGLAARSLVSYADDEPPTSTQTSQNAGPQKEGRKIWWPTIGTTDEALSEDHLRSA
ncbi:MAG: hypothetical protein Q9182_003209 [Xanthomendoza sp. 2 TL-2023]